MVCDRHVRMICIMTIQCKHEIHEGLHETAYVLIERHALNDHWAMFLILKL